MTFNRQKNPSLKLYLRPTVHKNQISQQNHQIDHSKSSISLSNKINLNREKFHSSINSKLDVRDEVIRLPLEITLSRLDYNKDKSAIYEPIVEWLADVVEAVLSVTFNFLLEEKLNVNEAKSYAAKNILINIKQLCENYWKALQEEPGQEFLNFLDETLEQIIGEIIAKYPQTSSKGASKKIRSFIRKISIRQDDEYDFFYKHGVKFQFKSNGDYSSEIMEALNKIITKPNEDSDDANSLIDSYKLFCRHLFYYSSKEKLYPISQFVEKSKLNQTSKFNQEAIKQQHSYQPVKLNTSNISLNDEQIKRQQFLMRADQQFFDKLANEISKSDQGNEDLINFQRQKKNHYGIGQKIPAEVRLFTSRQIKCGQFKVYHCSILRILTKWSQELMDKLQNADELIRHRFYKFKTNSGDLRYCKTEQKQYLFQEALKEKQKTQIYIKNLKDENKKLQSKFAIEFYQGKYIKKFSNVGYFSAKLQEIVGQYMFKYVNRLIHALLSISINAGQRISQYYRFYENKQKLGQKLKNSLSKLDLVSFKVGDLIRSKYSCSESQMMNILGSLYSLEEKEPAKLKLVKIKNRLDQKDNDILIDIFFKNTILCQMQLSIISQENKKEISYSNFNHFLYQLKRSKFGTISQLSCVVVHYDPLINTYSLTKTLRPKLKPRSFSNETIVRGILGKNICRFDQTVKRQIVNQLDEKAIEKPFICDGCGELHQVFNPKFYYRQIQFSSYCNDCMDEEFCNNKDKSKKILQEFFQNYCLDEKMNTFLKQIKLWNFAEKLKNIKKQRQLFVNFIEYGFIIEKGTKIPTVKPFKTFFNSIDNLVVLSTLQNGQSKNFLRLSCKQEKGISSFLDRMQLYYFFKLQICEKQDIESFFHECLFEQNMKTVALKIFQITEQQMIRIDNIHYIRDCLEKYHQTLYLCDRKYILKQITEHLEEGSQNKRLKKKLQFQKNALCVKSLLAQGCQIEEIQDIIKSFSNVTQINLGSNKIRQIKNLNYLKFLSKIVLSNNIIENIQNLHELIWLTHIKLNNNSMTGLYGVKGLTRLKSLNCNDNKIKRILGLENLPFLEELFLASNNIQKIEGLEKLRKLKNLDLSQNKIFIMQNLSLLNELNFLNLSQNLILKIEQISQLRNLTNLSLFKNYISKIDGLGTIKLININLAFNQIKKIQSLQFLVELQVLNLEKNLIQNIQGLENLQKLRQLILSHNKIKDITNLEKLRNLETLKIDNNPLVKHAGVENLKNLSTLSLESSGILNTNGIGKFKKLFALNLANNQIQELQEMNELSKVCTLNLSNNNISEIKNMQKMINLQTVSFSTNKIKKIENLQGLIEIIWLVFTKNQIKVIQGLQSLHDLRILQLQYNEIVKIQGLNRLKNIMQLWLDKNNITKIENLSGLKLLKRLGLSQNRISKIEGLQSLVSLELLQLGENKIENIQGLEGLQELLRLQLPKNQIRYIQGLQNLQHLQYLSLENNFIQEIQGLERLKKLTFLNLRFNQIQILKGLKQLVSLEKLYLCHNRIEKIEGLDKLVRLNELKLSSNKIPAIQNIQGLVRLKFLDLSSNKIKDLDEKFFIKSLETINMANNLIQQFVNKEIGHLKISVLKNSIAQLQDEQDEKDGKNTKTNMKYFEIIQKREAENVKRFQSQVTTVKQNKNRFTQKNIQEKQIELRSKIGIGITSSQIVYNFDRRKYD